MCQDKSEIHPFLNHLISIHSIALQQFCKGDNQALSTLYKKWLPELYLVAYRYVQCEQEAEDIVADCFEKIFAMPITKRQQKFIEEEINIKALLLVMVKNKSLDVIKTKKNRNRILEGIKGFLPTISFNNAKQNLTNDNFKELLNCLPKKEKQILSLSIDGFTNAEIGEQFNLSEKTIANLLAMVRKKVKNLWNTFME
ncbi:MAG: RNA polymerase sigma factor [Flavobacterium macrobrachii]